MLHKILLKVKQINYKNIIVTVLITKNCINVI